jgi:hypothetical protein
LGEEMLKGNKKVVKLVEYLTVIIPAIALIGGIYPIMMVVNKWANMAFARPILASCLVAAIDVVLFLLVLALVPSLSWLLARVTRRL